ncbi:MAG: hypothetical protein NW214_16560 [Pseudanabaenaceae cyanobacterium bins.39]|nr:hypothetical protein [Pseudanabaenaceae cyanobacterium bins.39]
MERNIQCSLLTVKDADGYEHSFTKGWFCSLTVELNEARRDIRVTKQGIFAPKTVVFFSRVKFYQYEEAA